MAHSHVGHRARLRRRAQWEGLTGFAPHEVVELMLFPALPQRDLNPLGHALVQQFGSVGGVLDASVSQLAQVAGMGQGSAGWVALLGEAARRYAGLTLQERPRFDRLNQVKKYCAQLFGRAQEQQLWVFSMNLSGHLLGSTLVCQGEARRDVSLRQLVEPLVFHRAQNAVLVQWRGVGNLAPDKWDLDMTVRLAKQLETLKILLLDSVLMAGQSVVSLRKERMYRLGGEGVLCEAGAPFSDWFEGE